jgi:hypothetical protein
VVEQSNPHTDIKGSNPSPAWHQGIMAQRERKGSKTDQGSGGSTLAAHLTPYPEDQGFSPATTWRKEIMPEKSILN